MASASWTNDAVMLTPPVGGTLPDSVRLQFALTVASLITDNSNLWPFRLPAQSSVRANNQSYKVGRCTTWKGPG